MLVAHSEWYTYRGGGRAGGGGWVNGGPTGLVSGGSGKEKKVMAQQGSISIFFFKAVVGRRGPEHSRLSHGAEEFLRWWKWAGHVWVSACEREWSSHTQHTQHLRPRGLDWNTGIYFLPTLGISKQAVALFSSTERKYAEIKYTDPSRFLAITPSIR